jgi:hypothetical protein
VNNHTRSPGDTTDSLTSWHEAEEEEARLHLPPNSSHTAVNKIFVDDPFGQHDHHLSSEARYEKICDEIASGLVNVAKLRDVLLARDIAAALVAHGCTTWADFTELAVTLSEFHEVGGLVSQHNMMGGGVTQNIRGMNTSSEWSHMKTPQVHNNNSLAHRPPPGSTSYNTVPEIQLAVSTARSKEDCETCRKFLQEAGVPMFVAAKLSAFLVRQPVYISFLQQHPQQPLC